MTIKLITGPAVEPISLADAKLHLKVDAADDDALIAILIASARLSAEHALGRVLLQQTWEMVIEAFPAAELEIRAAGVLGITAVKYINTAGVETTLSPAAYALDAESAPAYLLPAAGTAWPATADTTNAVRVRYTAGYGAAAADVPASIRHWLLLHIGSGYKHRETTAQGATVSALPGRYHDALLDGEKVYL